MRHSTLNQFIKNVQNQPNIIKVSGFTLIEMMITVAIAGVFLVIAIPSYTDFIARNRVDVEVQEFRTIITLARSEAIKRNRSVRVTGVNDWEDGYVMALASVANPESASDANVLRRYTPEDDNGITPTLDGGTPAASEITFLGSGLLAGNTEVILDFCSDNTTEDRRITINVTGRYSSEIGDCSTF